MDQFLATMKNPSWEKAPRAGLSLDNFCSLQGWACGLEETSKITGPALPWQPQAGF